jgi:ribosomal protein L16 Arg81 hydroxylase
MSGRVEDPDYELNIERHKHLVTMNTYVKMVQAQEGNDFYLVANNHFFKTKQELIADLRPFPAYLDSAKTSQEVFFWFGPAGTVTPLHHDEMNVFLAQIYGRKKIVLIPPLQISMLYNMTGVYSSVNYEKPDLQKFPLYDKIKRMEIILQAGEALFIPVGWWHYVKSIDISISVSFINFVFPNRYFWKNPSA